MRFDLDNDIIREMRETFFPMLYDAAQTYDYSEMYKYIRCYDDKNDEYYNEERIFALVTTYDRKLKSIVRIQTKTTIMRFVAHNKMIKDFQNWEYSKYMKYFNNRK